MSELSLINVVVEQVGGRSRGFEEQFEQGLPTADISHTTSPAATFALLERHRIDWLVLDYRGGRLAADYLDTVADRAPDCSVVLVTDDPLDDIRAPITLDVTIVRPESDTADADADFTRQVVEAISRSGGDDHASLEQLFDGHALPMLLIDPVSGTIIEANSAAVDFYGYTSAELIGMSIDDITATDATDVADRSQQATESAGKQFIFEHRTKTGDLRTVEVNSTPVQYGGRTVLFSIIQDITTWTKAKSELEDTTMLYKRLAEQNVVGIYIIQNRMFVYVNPKLAEIFGTTPDEMVGTPVFEYVAETDVERVRSRIAARETGLEESVQYTFTGKRPDGESVILEANGGRVETPDGVQIVGTLLDITERETQAHELRQLSQALEYAASAVYITNENGVIEYVNPEFEHITGYTEAEALGKDPVILNSGRMNSDYYRRLYETLGRGEVWEETIINRRKSGEFYYAYQTVAPYFDDTGAIEGYVAIQSDVTDQRITQQVIEVYQRILRHNLRNKLNIVRGNAELLKPDVRGTALEERVQKIDKAASALVELSEKARIANQAIEVGSDSRVTDLVELLAREQAILEAEYPDVTLAVHVPEEVCVYGGRPVEVCVHEVLENAVVHNDTPTPRVEVALRVDEEESIAELVVRDTGPGLRDTDREPIDLGSESPLRHAEGIGLWVVNWVVTSLGGEVEFADNEPRGLVVTLRLPYVDAAAD